MNVEQDGINYNEIYMNHLYGDALLQEQYLDGPEPGLERVGRWTTAPGAPYANDPAWFNPRPRGLPRLNMMGSGWLDDTKDVLGTGYIDHMWPASRGGPEGRRRAWDAWWSGGKQGPNPDEVATGWSESVRGPLIGQVVRDPDKGGLFSDILNGIADLAPGLSLAAGPLGQAIGVPLSLSQLITKVSEINPVSSLSNLFSNGSSEAVASSGMDVGMPEPNNIINENTLARASMMTRGNDNSILPTSPDSPRQVSFDGPELPPSPGGAGTPDWWDFGASTPNIPGSAATGIPTSGMLTAATAAIPGLTGKGKEENNMGWLEQSGGTMPEWESTGWEGSNPNWNISGEGEWGNPYESGVNSVSMNDYDQMITGEDQALGKNMLEGMGVNYENFIKNPLGKSLLQRLLSTGGKALFGGRGWNATGGKQGEYQFPWENVITSILSNQSLNKYRSDLLGVMNKAIDKADPFASERGRYQSQLRDLTTTPSNFLKDPGIADLMNYEGEATGRLLGSQGYNMSGNFAKEVADSRNRTAFQNYLPYLDQISKNAGAYFGPSNAGTMTGTIGTEAAKAGLNQGGYLGNIIGDVVRGRQPTTGTRNQGLYELIRESF